MPHIFDVHKHHSTLLGFNNGLHQQRNQFITNLSILEVTHVIDWLWNERLSEKITTKKPSTQFFYLNWKGVIRMLKFKIRYYFDLAKTNNWKFHLSIHLPIRNIRTWFMLCFQQEINRKMTRTNRNFGKQIMVSYGNSISTREHADTWIKWELE